MTELYITQLRKYCFKTSEQQMVFLKFSHSKITPYAVCSTWYEHTYQFTYQTLCMYNYCLTIC